MSELLIVFRLAPLNKNIAMLDRKLFFNFSYRNPFESREDDGTEEWCSEGLNRWNCSFI